MFKIKLNHIIYYLVIFFAFYLYLNTLDSFNTIVPQWYPNITNYLIYDISRINPQKAFDEPFNKSYTIFFDISFSLLVFYIIFIYFFKFYLEDKNEIFHMKIIWIFKILVSLFFIIFYELNFGLDQNTYYYLSVNKVNVFSDNFGLGSMSIFPNFSSNSNMVNVLRYINFFTLNSWFCIKIFFTLISLITVINFYKIISILYGDKKIIILYLLCILPSFLIFTSIITKDAIILFLTSFVFLKIIEFDKNKILNFISIIFCLSLIFIFRKWVSLFIICSLISTVFIIYFYRIKIKYRFVLYCLILIFVILGFDYLNSKLILTETKDIFAVFFRYIMAANYLSGYIDINSPNITDTTCLSCSGSRSLVNKSNILEILVLYPKMMFMSIFSPFIFDFRKFSYLVPILENIGVLILLVIATFNLNKKHLIYYFYLINLTLIFTICYAVINYLNIGNSFRYSLFMRYILYVFAIAVNVKLIENIYFYVYKKIKNLRGYFNQF